MSSNKYHHGDLKASLIEAANTILLRDGADALSLRAIAAEVGVSHMAPYAHFKNKKELITSIAEAGFVQMADTMEAVAHALTAKKTVSAGELILAYGASYLEFATSNPQLYRLMLGQVETTGRKNKKGDTQTESNVKTNAVNSPFIESSKKPFILLREAFALRGDTDERVKAQALGAWSMVHGMAALVIEGHIQVPEGTSFKHFLAAATPLADQFKDSF
ncbi:probable transcription regulator, TetR family [Oleispira antarctica RB-8]|uniref:Probable transcription regulator, TetR family n=1 Tax=Oleispira antarctica RB-8 TaxID=698738 RepID=R4YQT3_OLEAN|nr:probable transcription regulator, TetR family [Oleispira antarctica RB-8]